MLRYENAGLAEPVRGARHPAVMRRRTSSVTSLNGAEATPRIGMPTRRDSDGRAETDSPEVRAGLERVGVGSVATGRNGPAGAPTGSATSLTAPFPSVEDRRAAFKRLEPTLRVHFSATVLVWSRLDAGLRARTLPVGDGCRDRIFAHRRGAAAPARRQRRVNRHHHRPCGVGRGCANFSSAPARQQFCRITRRRGTDYGGIRCGAATAPRGRHPRRPRVRGCWPVDICPYERARRGPLAPRRSVAPRRSAPGTGMCRGALRKRPAAADATYGR
jgi:hypothetical protein